MMCDVMPTISEDSISQRSSQFSGEDANFEQLMVSMLDERDKLMDSLRETQERLGDTELKLADVEKERDSLQRQIAANLPQVSESVTSRTTASQSWSSIDSFCHVPIAPFSHMNFLVFTVKYSEASPGLGFSNGEKS